MYCKTLVLLTTLGLTSSWSVAQTVSEVLPNGLTVVIKEDKRAPVAVSQIWYRVGSVDEITGQTGLSHALEHMMFKGTKKIAAGEYSRKIAAMGGSDNAFTSNDQTVYYAKVAANRLPEVLALEADRMVNLNFSDTDFVNEMKVIREERRMRTDDQPNGVLYEALYANAFIANPVRTPVIGWMDDLEQLKAEQLRTWYRQWYAPNNATIVIVGDVDPQKTLNNIRRQFGKIKSQKLPERQLTAEPRQSGIKRVQVSAPSELPMLALAYKVPRLQAIDDKMPYALSVLSAVLDGHEASRLSKRLVREKQLALSVGAGYDGLSRGDALFLLTGVLAQNVSLGELEKQLKAQIAEIAQHGVGEEELSVLRNQSDAYDVYQKDSMYAQAMSIGNLQLNGFSYQDEDRIKQNEQSVTISDVQKAAQSLIEDNLTVITLKPLPIDHPQEASDIGENAHVR